MKTSQSEPGAIFLEPRTPHNDIIRLSPYDPAWPRVFAAQEAAILAALGAEALAVHHAGSTAVPGLSAKPVIDIVLAVRDPVNESAYVAALAGRGFRLHAREPSWFEHRLLKGGNPAVNLHVFALGCSEIARMLAFRDWLRTHAEDRRLYETRKQELAARTWEWVQDYADAKTEVVQALVARAMGPKRRRGVR